MEMSTGEATKPPIRVDPEKNNEKRRRKRPRRHRQRGLIGPLRRFWSNVLTGHPFAERNLGDSSADSTFGSNSDDEKGPLGSSSSTSSSSQEPQGVRFRNMHAHDDRSMERRKGERLEYNQEILGFYDENLAETIEDDIHILVGSNGSCEGIKIIDFPMSMEIDGTDSIILEVTSIETEYDRPSAACCYCAERVIKSPLRTRSFAKRKKKTKNNSKPQIIRKITNDNTINHKTWNRAEMTSMLSDDDIEFDQNGGFDVEDSTSPRSHGITSTTLEECEARFMEELESAQNEDYNLENSHWKKGFEFVRSWSKQFYYKFDEL